MVTYAQLNSLDTSNLSTAATASSELSADLSTRGEEVQSASDFDAAMWYGFDATAAATRISAQAPPLFDASDAFQRSHAVLEDLVSDLESAREHLQGAHELVSGNPAVTIVGDGTVHVAPASTPDQAAINDEIARQARQIIDESLDMAVEADETAHSAFQAVSGDSFHDVDQNNIPDADSDPEDVNDWWEGLSDEEQQAYIHNHPELIGDLDGIPSEARDQANRFNLENQIDEREERLQELRDSGRLGAPGASDARAERDRLESELEGLNALSNQLDENPDYLLLGVDGADDGQAIVATGDPDGADYVLTHVPGTGADLAGLNSDLSRVDRMTYDANQLEDGETVGIMWLGYDAPDGLNNAVSGSYAADAADDFSSFNDGLRATHTDGGSLNTAVGHSYGSTVIGHSALDAGVDTDQMVFLGSPGPEADTAAELGIGPDNVYASTAENDIINTAAGQGWLHGTDPTSDEFGGQVFDSDPGTEASGWERIFGGSTDAHSEYWDDGNVARDNIAKIVTGNGEEVAVTAEQPDPVDPNLPQPTPTSPPEPPPSTPSPSPQPQPAEPGPTPTPPPTGGN